MASIPILFIAILIVCSLVLIFYRIYKVFHTDSSVIKGKMPIFDDKLIKLDNWRDYMLFKYRLIKNDYYKYVLLINFDMNNLPNLFQMIKEKDQQQYAAEKQAKDSQVSMFDVIVRTLDQSTDNQQLLDPVSVSDKDINNVAANTESLLGLSNNAVSNLVDSVPTLDQTEINDIYRLLDMINVDINIKQIIGFQYDKRKLFIQIPLIRIEKTQDFTHLRFDPGQVLNGLSTDFIATKTKDLTNIIEFVVYTNQIVIYPINRPSNKIIIPLT